MKVKPNKNQKLSECCVIDNVDINVLLIKQVDYKA